MLFSRNKIKTIFKLFKKGQIEISIDFDAKFIIYISILTIFLFYQFNLINYIALDIRTTVLVSLGFAWSLLLPSYKTGHLLGHSLSKKAVSRAVLYLLVFTFFLVYTFFISDNFSGERGIVFAASAYRCCDTIGECTLHYCVCDYTDNCLDLGYYQWCEDPVSGYCGTICHQCCKGNDCDMHDIGDACTSCVEYCFDQVLYEYDTDTTNYDNVKNTGNMLCSASCDCASCPAAGSAACDTECDANANCEGDPEGWVVCSSGTESVICCNTAGDGNCQVDCNEGTPASRANCDEKASGCEYCSSGIATDSCCNSAGNGKCEYNNCCSGTTPATQSVCDEDASGTVHCDASGVHVATCCNTAGDNLCESSCTAGTPASSNCDECASGTVYCTNGIATNNCCTSAGDGLCESTCGCGGTPANANCDENSASTCGNGAPPAGYCTSTCGLQTAETSAEACRCISCGTDNSGAPESCDDNSEQAGTQDPWKATWTGDVSGIYCCGNDASEYPTFRNCSATACTSDTNDVACCSLATKCVYSGTCYSNGDTSDIDGDGWVEKCIGGSSGQWVDGAPPRFSLNNTNTTSICSGDPVLIYANWTDDTSLNVSWLWTNETGGNGKNWTANYNSPVDINLTGTQTWSNFTWSNSSVSGGTVIAWRIYANDSSGNENVTGQGTFTVQRAFLEVNLTTPTAGANTNVVQNNTFTVNATVYCRTCSCSNVNGTVRYNQTGSMYPNASISTTAGATPFYIQETNAIAMKSCPTNPLIQNEFCNLTWTVNATGSQNSAWKVGVLFNSSDTSIANNHTNNATITITGVQESIQISWTTITFPNLSPNTVGNNATNNNQGGYNITNTGSCTLRTWINGTDLTNRTITPTPSTIKVGNISYSNSSNNYAASTRMATSLALISPNHATNTNTTLYFWFDVPAIYAGNYTGNVTVCGNCTGGSLC